MKHYSYFIQPGYRRGSGRRPAPRVCWLGLSFARRPAVRRGVHQPEHQHRDHPGHEFRLLSVLRLERLSNRRLKLLAVARLCRPAIGPAPSSLTTVVLDKYLAVGAATNPAPAIGATNVALDSTLKWSSGSNALTHAVYLGFDSNAVAQARDRFARISGNPHDEPSRLRSTAARPISGAWMKSRAPTPIRASSGPSARCPPGPRSSLQFQRDRRNERGRFRGRPGLDRHAAERRHPFGRPVDVVVQLRSNTCSAAGNRQHAEQFHH